MQISVYSISYGMKCGTRVKRCSSSTDRLYPRYKELNIGYTQVYQRPKQIHTKAMGMTEVLMITFVRSMIIGFASVLDLWFTRYHESIEIWVSCYMRIMPRYYYPCAYRMNAACLNVAQVHYGLVPHFGGHFLRSCHYLMT